MRASSARSHRCATHRWDRRTTCSSILPATATSEPGTEDGFSDSGRRLVRRKHMGRRHGDSPHRRQDAGQAHVARLGQLLLWHADEVNRHAARQRSFSRGSRAQGLLSGDHIGRARAGGGWRAQRLSLFAYTLTSYLANQSKAYVTASQLSPTLRPSSPTLRIRNRHLSTAEIPGTFDQNGEFVFALVPHAGGAPVQPSALPKVSVPAPAPDSTSPANAANGVNGHAPSPPTLGVAGSAVKSATDSSGSLVQ